MPTTGFSVRAIKSTTDLPVDFANNRNRVPWRGVLRGHDRRTMLCRESDEERLNVTTAAAVGYP